MAKHPARNNFTTEEPVVKEEPKEILAEETAEKTEEKVSEKSEVSEKAKEPEVVAVAEEKPVEEAPKAAEAKEEKNANMVRVACDQLYLRPEPNKVGTPLGILEKGNKLSLVESDAKLPAEWIEVATVPAGTRGYVMKEFVERI